MDFREKRRCLIDANTSINDALLEVEKLKRNENKESTEKALLYIKDSEDYMFRVIEKNADNEIQKAMLESKMKEVEKARKSLVFFYEKNKEKIGIIKELERS